jgi:hypothetical protein
MTPKFSVIVAVAGLALLVAAPASGKTQPVEEQWQKALQARGTALNAQHGLGGTTQDTTTTSTYEQALQARSEGLNRIYELGSSAPVRVVTSERATPEQGTTSYEQALVLRGQELNRQHELGSFAPQYIDAGERAIRVQDTGPAIVPDALERAVANTGTDGFVKGDDFVRIDPADLPTVVPVATTSPTGTEVQWPQIGIGFGIGVLLMLGLALTWRLTRVRTLAH